MWKFLVLFFISLLAISEGIRCYNCFTITELHLSRGEELVPCSDNITQSNVWDCPEDYLYCASVVYEALGDPSSQTILRTCSQGEKITCNQEIPDLVERSCKLCENNLCNGELV